MNDRIKELAEQCQVETYGVNGELLASWFDSEKFADSLIRECARVVNDNNFDGCTLGDRLLFEHFGIDEGN